MAKNYSLGVLRFMLVAFVTVYLASCAQKIVFQNSAVVPGATGKVKIKKDGNNNYTIDLSLENLAAPDRLTPPADLYIVWIDTKENGVKNIGRIASTSSFFSGKKKASLKTVSLFKPTRVFITAENRIDVTYPGSQEVLTTRYL